MSETKCKHGLVPEECPVALGIYVDGIRFDGDEETVYRKWQAVCNQVGGACPRDRGIEGWGDE